ncbi:MAG: hypothetical protein MHPSP_002608 [Paramarteilia canceri]
MTRTESVGAFITTFICSAITVPAFYKCLQYKNYIEDVKSRRILPKVVQIDDIEDTEEAEKAKKNLKLGESKEELEEFYKKMKVSIDDWENKPFPKEKLVKPDYYIKKK